MRVRRFRWGAVAAFAAAMAAAPTATGAEPEPVFEEFLVPTVGDAKVNVEVMRPKGEPNAPVILTYSPYNTLSEDASPNLANDSLGQRFLKRGYARAVADVLGTRNSTGCWDYGGTKETRSGVDLVNFLASRGWSNGRVGMIGGSYDGTTATMVASQGNAAPGLKAIVPIAGISRWYGYAYSHGIRYFGNTEVPSDEGADTPLAFDFGLSRTPPTDPTDPTFVDAFMSRVNPCDSVQHTRRGYDDTPDYNSFWVERDYRRHADRIRAAVLVAHGWQDYNVKQEEGVRLFERLREDDPDTAATEGVPFKRLHMFQGPHGNPNDSEWQPLLSRFFRRTLKGIHNGIESEPEVRTEGRTADDASIGFDVAPSWPPHGTEHLSLFLRRGDGGGQLRAHPPAARSVASYTDTASQTEEESSEAPDSEQNWLFYQSPPLARDARLAGEARLRTTLSSNRDHAHLTPILVDVGPDGAVNTVSRGFLNLGYRHGLDYLEAIPVRDPFGATVTFKPQDQTFEAGHRIGVLVQSSNTAWAIPDDPGAELTVHHGRGTGPTTRLTVPLVDPAPGLFD